MISKGGFSASLSFRRVNFEKYAASLKSSECRMNVDQHSEEYPDKKKMSGSKFVLPTALLISPLAIPPRAYDLLKGESSSPTADILHFTCSSI